MDDDALRDIEKGHSGSAVIEEGEVALSMKVSLFSLETKSLSGVGTLPASMDEAKINNCTLIFFEGGQVNSIMEGLFVNSENYIVKKKNGTEDDWAKVIVKVKKPSPYSVMLIANSSKSFAGCQSESDINDIIQDNKDALVKVGKMNINFDSNFAGYATIREALEKPLEVGPVPLSQLTARIELAEFNVSGFQGASVQEKITVTGVDLLNLILRVIRQMSKLIKMRLITQRVRRVMWRYIMEHQSFRQLILLWRIKMYCLFTRSGIWRRQKVIK